MNEKRKEFEAPQKLLALLNEEYDWPCSYTFKFIVPPEKVHILKNIVKSEEAKLNPSRNGKYISVTIKKEMESAEKVIEVYADASTIEGIISL